MHEILVKTNETPEEFAMIMPNSAGRLISVARKEFLHIIRDLMTLFFTLFVPIVEMFLLGYAIDRAGH